MPDIVTRYKFTAASGLAAQARLADPTVSDDLTAEMTDLDLPPDTTVTIVGHDDARDLVLFEWVDRSGTPRITSVEPDAFAANFALEG